MQKLWCTDFEGFKQLVEANGWTESVPDNIAIISINNGKDAGTIEECHLCTGENVLNLNFDDIDPTVLGLSEDATEYTYQTKDGRLNTVEFFTREQAEAAIKFIEKYQNRDFYIHCSAGISRSQAFIRFIQTVYHEINWGLNPVNPCIHPNGFVCQKLLQVWRENIDFSKIFE